MLHRLGVVMIRSEKIDGRNAAPSHTKWSGHILNITQASHFSASLSCANSCSWLRLLLYVQIQVAHTWRNPFGIVSVKRYLGATRIHIYRPGIPPDRWDAGSDNNKSAFPVSDLHSPADRRHGHESVKSSVKSWPRSQFMNEGMPLGQTGLE